METLYDILEVSRKASKEIIEKAYKTLAKKYHPDLQTAENRAYAEEMMKKINEAYDVLSDDTKRSEYDRQLEEQEQQKYEQRQYQQEQQFYQGQQQYQQYQEQQRSYNNANMNYSNSNQNNVYDRQQNVNTGTNENNGNDWRSQFAKLNRRDQKKVIKKIEKDANEEYRKQYESYFRSLGFRIKHKWTLKDFIIIGIVILVLTFIFSILWLIPSTHEWLVQIYEENFLIKILVDIIRGIFQGIIKFFKNITKF